MTKVHPSILMATNPWTKTGLGWSKPTRPAHSVQRICLGREPGFGALKGAPVVPVTANSRTVTGALFVHHYTTPPVRSHTFTWLRGPIWTQALVTVRPLPRKMLKGMNQ